MRVYDIFVQNFKKSTVCGFALSLGYRGFILPRLFRSEASSPLPSREAKNQRTDSDNGKCQDRLLSPALGIRAIVTEPARESAFMEFGAEAMILDQTVRFAVRQIRKPTLDHVYPVREEKNHPMSLLAFAESESE